MCDFRDGQQYPLITDTNCNKSLLFVKLTDSALHSIEHFLQTKGSSSATPTIQFFTNKGTVTLPISGQTITYGFTLSNLEADGSSFQCLQHTKQRSLKSLGPMHIKMQIHANEDSYAKTRCKMAAVEQEQKSLCTKEIKPNGSHLSGKKKIKRTGNVFPPKISPVAKIDNQTCFVKPKAVASSNLLLSKESVRKRIIHILAAKPYKKPDILLRLMKEGINDKDRKTVPDVLDQVCSQKGNMYTLSSHLWKEVDDNWKFCSKEELEIIRRRKLQFLKADNEDPISQNSAEKRVDNIPAFKEPQNKKQRISHYNAFKVPEQIVKAGYSECNTSGVLKQAKVENCQKIPFSNQVNGVSNGASETNGKHSRGLSAHFNLSRRNRMECSGINPTKPSIKDSLPECNLSSHTLKNHKITSKEERDQYAQDFNVQYVEYMKLHTRMKNISERLASLEKHLHNSQKGSEEFKKTRREIHKIYKATVQSNHYMEDWKKFNSLQSNLSHMKNLITEYDSAES